MIVQPSPSTEHAVDDDNDPVRRQPTELAALGIKSQLNEVESAVPETSFAASVTDAISYTHDAGETTKRDKLNIRDGAVHETTKENLLATKELKFKISSTDESASALAIGAPSTCARKDSTTSAKPATTKTFFRQTSVSSNCFLILTETEDEESRELIPLFHKKRLAISGEQWKSWKQAEAKRAAMAKREEKLSKQKSRESRRHRTPLGRPNRQMRRSFSR